MADSLLIAPNGSFVTNPVFQAKGFISWKITNYSGMEARCSKSKNKHFDSPSITINQKPWFIKIFPAGNKTGDEDLDCIAIYLACGDITDDLHVSFTITLKGASTFPDLIRKASGILDVKNADHGFTKFIEKSSMTSYLDDDELTITCSFAVSDVDVESKVDDLFVLVPECDLADNLTQTLNSDDPFSDVVLVVGEERIRAHKVILAARSPVFRRMFTIDMREKTDKEVKLEEDHPSVFKEVLKFMYSGKMDPDFMVDNIENVLAIAEKYNVTRLSMLCADVLAKRLKTSTAINILSAATQFNCFPLRICVINFIAEHFVEVIKMNDFKDWALQNPALIAEIHEAIAVKPSLLISRKKRKREPQEDV